MFTCSGIFGNTFSYLYFRDSHEIDTRTRNIFNGVLLCVNVAGAFVFLFTRRVPSREGAAESHDDSDTKPLTPPPKPDSPLVAVKKAFKLACTTDMLILTSYFAYMGVNQGFMSIYSVSLSFNRGFEDGSNGLTGLHGILFSCGTAVAGMSFAFYGRPVGERLGRSPIVISVIALNLVGYIIAGLNLPYDAPHAPTEEDSFISPSSLPLALTVSFAFGLGDGTLIAQTMELLASVYERRGQSRQAFAVYKTCQFGAEAVVFGYAGYMSLYWQLGIVGTVGVIAATCFTIVDVRSRKREKHATSSGDSVRREFSPE